MYMLRTCKMLVLFKNKKLSLYRLTHCLMPFMWTTGSDRTRRCRVNITILYS